MLNLALPVIFTYMGLMLMGQVDLICVGRISATSIGAVGVGTSIFSWFLMFGIGLLSSLEYLSAKSHGEANSHDAHIYFSQGFWISWIVGLPLTLAMLLIAQNLEILGINPEVIPQARDYLWVLSFSLIPTLLFTVCRTQLQALGEAKFALYVLIAANLLNLGANSVFVLGAFGFPAMMAKGAAIATLISRLFMCFTIFGCFIYWDHKSSNELQKNGLPLVRKHLLEIFRVGIPTSLQMAFEVGVFALSTLLAARLSAETLAAHQIVLNIASFTFMVPLAVGSATAVLVGKEMGKKDFPAAVTMGWKGLRLGIGFMACSGIILVSFSHQIVAFYTNATGVVPQAQAVLLVAAFFQLSDGAQTVGSGALRGLGDTRTSMVVNLLGHWGIGLPIGAYLCFVANQGLRGLWIGLSLGLTSVAISLLIKWISLTRKLLLQP